MISAGLFLGSGRSLASAGPGGAVVAYVLMGTGEQLAVQLRPSLVVTMLTHSPI